VPVLESQIFNTMMNSAVCGLLLIALLTCAGCIQEGENRLVFLNGNMQCVFTAKRLPDGRLVKVGICSTWFASGQFHRVESYDERGYPAGVWQVWNEKRQKLCEGKHRREGDSLKTIWTFFHDNGSVCRSEAYLNGEKHGRWFYWHDDSTLCQVPHFQNDTAFEVQSSMERRGRCAKIEEYRNGVKYNEVIFTNKPQTAE
jgi:antitoxin component YwqK of YwqJK toxin-antitoxin module